jgi:CheY-like chemotaxis protein
MASSGNRTASSTSIPRRAPAPRFEFSCPARTDLPTAKLLRKKGYRVVTAADGAAALELLRQPQVQVDLVLSDVDMPNVNGRTLADRIALERPRLPVILMSGYTAEELPDERHGGRPLRFISKPFTIDELTTAIHAALNAVQA